MLNLRPLEIGTLLCALAAGCSTTTTAGPTPTTSAGASTTGTPALPDRDPALAHRLVSEGAVLLDVRTLAEWDKGHLDGAEHIPLGELPSKLKAVEALTNGDKSKPIVLYCRSGARAGRAKEQLVAAGYTQVTNLGGMNDWGQ